MASPHGLVIAAPSSGSGKTLVTLGLLRALANRGASVASAKTGPDYIDPRYHEAASGKPCVNLDCWAMRPELVRTLAASSAANANLLVVEGVMGLFDGAAAGGGSTADLAVLLGLPVILVVDAPRQGQSVAALVKGFAEFRNNCALAGVILNRVASETHEILLRDAIEPLDIPVIGAVPEQQALSVPSRHLGLVQASEHGELNAFLDEAGALMARSIDTEAIERLAAPVEPNNATVTALPPLGQRIAVARDEAFGFAYPHLLDGWQSTGAQILPFSPLANESPDANADAIFLPGGYPELNAGKIAAADTFLDGLMSAASNGALIYGECGGYMVLGESLTDAGGTAHTMAGLLPVATSFSKRKLNLGYRKLTQSNALPWPRALRGHEFHYSTIERQGEAENLFDAADSHGEQLGPLGLRRGNVMGSYAHIIDMEAAA